MNKMSDQRYLLEEQYRDALNLNARIRLHERFSANPYNIFLWMFDHITLPTEARVLELGCGPGQLWLHNPHRIPAGWSITLSDFSPGMLDEARRNLSGADHPFAFQVVDAQQIPFNDSSFDAVIANHMLYHVPDRPTAFAEIRRVLRPGGSLYAATLGHAHMRELHDLRRTANPEATSLNSRLPEAFGLENGAAQLAPFFSDVSLHRYEDSLRVTEAAPLVEYVLSSNFGAALTGEKLACFRSLIEEEIAQHGAMHVSKDSGLFVASR